MYLNSPDKWRPDDLSSNTVQRILDEVRAGNLSTEKAAEMLGAAPFIDMGFAKLDTHREVRNGFPEVVFCQGKRADHVAQIFQRLSSTSGRVLGTRATPEQYLAVKELVPGATFREDARCILVQSEEVTPQPGTVMVVAAGTSDWPVAEEAAITAEIMGNQVERLYDVGVAGIHRLFAHLERLRSARVLIVVAGMEGALPSVVGGLVSRPVIAVPTSVGYGASFGGLSALLGMLNSCASGITVVNIDNGFGAGYAATLINRL